MKKSLSILLVSMFLVTAPVMTVRAETVEPTLTPYITETAEPTPSITPEPVQTPDLTPEPSASPVQTETPEQTPSASPVQTETPEQTPTASPVQTETPEPSVSPEPGVSPTLSPEPTIVLTADTALEMLRAYDGLESFTREQRNEISASVEFLLNAKDAEFDPLWLEVLYAKANGITVVTPEGITAEGMALSVPADEAFLSTVELVMDEKDAADLIVPNEYGRSEKLALEISLLRFDPPLFAPMTVTGSIDRDGSDGPEPSDTPDLTAESEEPIKITEPVVPVRITMPVPERFIGKEGLVLLHYEDENAAPDVIIPYFSEDGTLMTFSTESFSTFVLTYESGIEPVYLIDIPGEIDFGKLRPGEGEKTETFTVTVSNMDIGSGKLVLSLQGDFTLRTPKGAELPFEVFGPQSTKALKTGEVFCEFSQPEDTADTAEGSISIDLEQIKYAGNYTGVLTFSSEYIEGG